MPGLTDAVKPIVAEAEEVELAFRDERSNVLGVQGQAPGSM